MLLEDVRRLADGGRRRPAARSRRCGSTRPALAAWLEANDVGDAVELHGLEAADADPCARRRGRSLRHSEQLYERAAEPKRLLLLEGGDHRSAQHDAEIQGESLRWLARAI